jgi:hypothetical protein
MNFMKMRLYEKWGEQHVNTLKGHVNNPKNVGPIVSQKPT